MVAVYTSDSDVRPIAFLAPAFFITQSDGNTYFRIPEGAEGSVNFKIRRTVGGQVAESGDYATLADYRNDQWPPAGEGGYEAESAREDPMFRSFDTATGRPRHGDDLGLHAESPAKDSTVTLPEELREMYLEATEEEPLDRGCYPFSGARLRVGVDGRRVFPRMRAGLGNGTHPDDVPPVFAPRRLTGWDIGLGQMRKALDLLLPPSDHCQECPINRKSFASNQSAGSAVGHRSLLPTTLAEGVGRQPLPASAAWNLSTGLSCEAQVRQPRPAVQPPMTSSWRAGVSARAGHRILV